MTTTAHDKYPHRPGWLYGCAACEERCVCVPAEIAVPCVAPGCVNSDSASRPVSSRVITEQERTT